MSPPLPQLPGYQVLDLIGRGGFGVVYRAVQEAVDREVAIKVDSRIVLDERDRRRFLREARAAGRLSGHPHAVDLYDAGVLPDGRPYLVMELCTGGSLVSWLSVAGPMRPADVCDLGSKIADVLAAAHEAGVLHRDIKPANILVNRYGVPMLTDFGLAALAEPGRDSSASLAALTPAYAAPEAFRQEPPTERADIYSLGATLYALLAGRPPRFPASGEPNLTEIIRLHNEPVADLPGLPAELTTALRRALAADPEQRYPDAAAFRDALAALRINPDLPAVVAAPARATVLDQPEDDLPDDDPAEDDPAEDEPAGDWDDDIPADDQAEPDYVDGDDAGGEPAQDQPEPDDQLTAVAELPVTRSVRFGPQRDDPTTVGRYAMLSPPPVNHGDAGDAGDALLDLLADQPTVPPTPVAAPGGGRAGRYLRRLLDAGPVRNAKRLVNKVGRGVTVGVSVAVLVAVGITWAVVANLSGGIDTAGILDVPGPDHRDGATDILLIGSDSRTDANGRPLPTDVLRQLRTEESAGLNTDTIIVVRLPHDGGRAHAMSIPRDVQVPIPGAGDGLINSAFWVGKRRTERALREDGVTDRSQLAMESDQAGRRMLVQVVQELTGVRIDHYAELNLLGFHEITEALGGVEVCLNAAVTDPDSGSDFTAGRQLVAGGDALSFVRQQRGLPNGDLDRIVRQQVFLAAVVNKALSTGVLANPGKLAKLANVAKRTMVIDDGWDVLDFARRMQDIAAGNVEFVTIPVAGVDHRAADGTSVVAVDRDQVRAFAVGLLGDPTATATASGPISPAGTVEPTSVVVNANNGSGQQGVADRVLAYLAQEGFTVGQVVDQAPSDEPSRVRVGPGGELVGRQVADLLGGLAVVTDPDLAGDRAEVQLGTGYSGPGAQGVAGERFLPPRQQQPAPGDPITADGIRCVN